MPEYHYRFLCTKCGEEIEWEGSDYSDDFYIEPCKTCLQEAAQHHAHLTERGNVANTLENVYVDFGDISAQSIIERLVELVGIEAVKSAVDEIATQQSVQMKMKTTKEMLIEKIEAYRPKTHREIDEDCFFSCPKAENYCGSDWECNCGFDFQNRNIDEMLVLLDECANESTSV